MAAEVHSTKTIGYSIHSCSSYSGDFVPDNVQVNKPHDSASRWSSNSTQPPQYIVLRLDRLVILKNITFGKYEQPHVCNVKNIQVFCGVDEDHMTLVLDDCLSNDPNPETFTINHTVSGHVVPTRFVKIVPLRTYGNSSFNFSIWFVKLEGCDDDNLVQSTHKWLQEHRENEAVRLCMKHLRQCNYTEAYEELRKKARVELEHPKLTELYECLVVRGDYESCERVMSEAAEEGLLDDYVTKQPIEAKWTHLEPKMTAGASHSKDQMCSVKAEGSSTHHGNSDSWPGMRGGHSMCVDSINEVIYLFGGYDGSRDLSDFWKFERQTSKWKLLSTDTRVQGGPSARSCHKMVLDSKHQKIYCLGHYHDLHSNSPALFTSQSDFYSYDIRSSSWNRLSDNTLKDGGPALIFDHQMSIDEDRQLIFVFGGKINSRNFPAPGFRSDDSAVLKGGYSGLFMYDITSNEWKQLRADGRNDFPGEIRGRMAHTMVYHPVRQELYIMGGQRNKEQLHDMLVYTVPTDVLTVHEEQKSTLGAMCGFALRAVIDPIKDEIHIYTGLDNRRETSNPDQLQTSLWIYNLTTRKFVCVYRHEMMGSSFWLLPQNRNKLPCPRFGHQFVYDHTHQIHYLFGGNPGNNKQPSMRLDDLWLLKFVRDSKEQVLRKSIFMVRQHQYEELIREDPVSSIHFLQTSISSIVNHDDWKEEQQFRSLSSTLFARDEHYDCHSRRSRLYDKLSRYFPTCMSQPNIDLCDLVAY